ncbi:RagB/SusD family nutrient uptake outer membrane protein [Cyclobacterium plantarum]|uniref:RagB/SusD family nutrient uptake outer membrane protein n=1 Tax=Cyclobacterium plantarum TaxID=2716263 RepID=A0ABX0HCY8_9BACT|nr:RagB/SusD family nutrient uptake outer membrane protein [Cyclobacterium plantarum]NHE59589.1 RagB/SusD family nutrient uptake outer membrane protein [Cyclobacterium plantarum]
MKSYHTYLVKFGLILSFGGLLACEELLIEEPKTVAVEVFYNTAEEVETAVNAIYSPLRSTRAEQIAILDAHTDWGYGRGSRAQYNDFAGLNPTNINTAGSRWDSFYQAIRNANLVIANAPEGDNISQENIDLYVAEAKFLRALSYFDLVRNWAGVPLRTEETMLEIDLPRSSEQEVYELILADLLDAESHLPENPKDLGRPTVYAAKTLLADVYLFLERYEDARNKALEVIQSNKYSLVPITNKEDIQLNIFGPELMTSSEEIFYFKYARELGQGNWMLFVLNHPSTGYFNFGGAYAHYSDATNPFYAEWEDGDIRKELWDQIDFGLGPTTLVSSKYVDPNAVDRLGAGNDLPIYRYAEVLLIFAEAEARSAGTVGQDAIDALNQVKRRAYGFSTQSPSPVDYQFNQNEVEAFLDAVLQERAYEFQFEGKRWLDLKRTGRAQEMILKNKGLEIAEAHYLWPIPLQETNFNGAIDPATDQNPGY